LIFVIILLSSIVIAPSPRPSLPGDIPPGGDTPNEANPYATPGSLANTAELFDIFPGAVSKSVDIDDKPPSTIISNTTATDGQSDPWFFINVTFTDSIYSIDTCWLEWRDTGVDDNITMNKSGVGTQVHCWINVTDATYGDANYTYKACANDTAGYYNCTSEGSFVFDSTPPNITITSPANGSTHDYGTALTVIAEVTDNFGTKNCSINVTNSTNATIYNNTKDCSTFTDTFILPSYIDTFTINVDVRDIHWVPGSTKNENETEIIIYTQIPTVAPPPTIGGGRAVRIPKEAVKGCCLCGLDPYSWIGIENVTADKCPEMLDGLVCRLVVHLYQ